MTRTQDIAVLKELRDNFKRDQKNLTHVNGVSTDDAVTALNSAIAHFTAIEAATGEEGKEHARALEKLSVVADFEIGLRDSERAALIAGAAAITALAASEAKVKALREALKERGHKGNCEMLKYYFSDEMRAQQKCTCGLAELLDNSAALKEVGHE